VKAYRHRLNHVRLAESDVRYRLQLGECSLACQRTVAVVRVPVELQTVVEHSQAGTDERVREVGDHLTRFDETTSDDAADRRVEHDEQSQEPVAGVSRAENVQYRDRAVMQQQTVVQWSLLSRYVSDDGAGGIHMKDCIAALTRVYVQAKLLFV